jgi:hypothetical protein
MIGSPTRHIMEGVHDRLSHTHRRNLAKEAEKHAVESGTHRGSIGTHRGSIGAVHRVSVGAHEKPVVVEGGARVADKIVVEGGAETREETRETPNVVTEALHIETMEGPMEGPHVADAMAEAAPAEAALSLSLSPSLSPSLHVMHLSATLFFTRSPTPSGPFNPRQPTSTHSDPLQLQL